MLAGEQATRHLLSRDGAPPPQVTVPQAIADGSVVMKAWIISLVCGVVAGVIYALLDVHSPAPPVVALLGLFGMLVGEQLIPVGRRLLSREPLTLAWFRHECVPKISGTAPLRPRRTSRRLMIC
jgi:XapX domain-containing protein